MPENEQNRARAAVAKDAGRKPRPQRGVEHVLWQTACGRQVDLEILENRPHGRGQNAVGGFLERATRMSPESPKQMLWSGRRVSVGQPWEIRRVPMIPDMRRLLERLGWDTRMEAHWR